MLLLINHSARGILFRKHPTAHHGHRGSAAHPLSLTFVIKPSSQLISSRLALLPACGDEPAHSCGPSSVHSVSCSLPEPELYRPAASLTPPSYSLDPRDIAPTCSVLLSLLMPPFPTPTQNASPGGPASPNSTHPIPCLPACLPASLPTPSFINSRGLAGGSCNCFPLLG